MKKQTIYLFLALVFFACEEKKAIPKPSPLVTVNLTEKKVRKCLRDSACIEIWLHYPILTGGDNSAAVNAINDSLCRKALSGLESDPVLTVEQAFDSVRTELYALVQEQVRKNPRWAGLFFRELKTKAILNTPRYISFEMAAGGFTGGAHPYANIALSSYDLATGKSVGLTQVVSDTSALQPMLERYFLSAKKAGLSDSITLADLLLPGITRLPVSANVCIIPEGLRFVYNPDKVSPWAVGATDLLLTWEQLGRLADRKKWLD